MEEIKKLASELEDFQNKHYQTLTKWNSLKKQFLQALFDKYCLKDGLTECEPFYCTFRMTGECEYIKKLKEYAHILQEY